MARFAERAAAAGKGPHIKAILLGRGLSWLADDDDPDHGALLARLRAAGLVELAVSRNAIHAPPCIFP